MQPQQTFVPFQLLANKKATGDGAVNTAVAAATVKIYVSNVS